VSSRPGDPEVQGLQRAGQTRIGVRWNRITPQDLLQVLSRSVARSLSTHADDLPLSRLRTIRSTALKLFVQGVRGRTRTMVGVPKQSFLRELDKNKNRLLMKCDDARAELRRLASSVDHLRTELPDPTPTDPARDRELDGELEQGLRRLFKLHGFGGDRGRALKEGVVAYVLSSSRQQRWQHLKGRLGEHRSQIDMLERRINKLTEALNRTEKVLHQVIHARQLDEAGIASIYREVQGLSLLDGQLLVKQEMLKAIFDANIELHRNIAA